MLSPSPAYARARLQPLRGRRYPAPEAAFSPAMLDSRLVPAALALCLLAACGSPPAPVPGSALPTAQLTAGGPRIASQSIFAASDLDTLRALVDVAARATVQQLGGVTAGYQCRPPYALGEDLCWPHESSRPGEAYLALAMQAGFCEDASAPQVYVSGHRLAVQVRLSAVSGCHINGVLALPTASLVSFSTRGVEPGLYSVSFRFASDTELYNSDATYLSVPGPPAEDQPTVETEAAGALEGVIGGRRVGLFSLARVDGAQLQGLCGETVSGPAYLATLDTDLSATPHRMTVVLAGPTPRTCTAAAI